MVVHPPVVECGDLDEVLAGAPDVDRAVVDDQHVGVVGEGQQLGEGLEGVLGLGDGEDARLEQLPRGVDQLHQVRRVVAAPVGVHVQVEDLLAPLQELPQPRPQLHVVPHHRRRRRGEVGRHLQHVHAVLPCRRRRAPVPAPGSVEQSHLGALVGGGLDEGLVEVQDQAQALVVEARLREALGLLRGALGREDEAGALALEEAEEGGVVAERGGVRGQAVAAAADGVGLQRREQEARDDARAAVGAQAAVDLHGVLAHAEGEEGGAEGEGGAGVREQGGAEPGGVCGEKGGDGARDGGGLCDVRDGFSGFELLGGALEEAGEGDGGEVGGGGDGGGGG